MKLEMEQGEDLSFQDLVDTIKKERIGGSVFYTNGLKLKDDPEDVYDEPR